MPLSTKKRVKEVLTRLLKVAKGHRRTASITDLVEYAVFLLFVVAEVVIWW
jgi:hypothetical protein